jgi:hypothetical protein
MSSTERTVGNRQYRFEATVAREVVDAPQQIWPSMEVPFVPFLGQDGQLAVKPGRLSIGQHPNTIICGFLQRASFGDGAMRAKLTVDRAL